MRLTTENYEIAHERKLLTHEKRFRTKIATRKILYLRNNHDKKLEPTKSSRKKFRTHEIPRENTSDPQNTHKKIFLTTKYPRRHNDKIAVDP